MKNQKEEKEEKIESEEPTDTAGAEGIHALGVEWKPADARTSNRVHLVIVVGCFLLSGMCMLWEYLLPAQP